jgi:hypothetical protein
MISVADLWCSQDRQSWDNALERYWTFVRPANLELERRMETLDLERIRRFDAAAWYEFLLNDYFRWKYTAPNRYVTTTNRLRDWVNSGRLAALASIKERLLTFDLRDVATGLSIASEIKGLGPAGASGLLAVLFPDAFGTADQFVVKALQAVPDLPESATLARMKPQQLSVADAAVLIGIMRRKASENNRTFGTSSWTPRKVDKVLWTYGR